MNLGDVLRNKTTGNIGVVVEVFPAGREGRTDEEVTIFYARDPNPYRIVGAATDFDVIYPLLDGVTRIPFPGWGEFPEDVRTKFYEIQARLGHHQEWVQMINGELQGLVAALNATKEFLFVETQEIQQQLSDATDLLGADLNEHIESSKDEILTKIIMNQAALLEELKKANRPWWKKLLG